MAREKKPVHTFPLVAIAIIVIVRTLGFLVSKISFICVLGENKAFL